MTTPANIFPKRLTFLSLLMLLLILGFGIFTQMRASLLLATFQSNDIPTLQLSCAATRVMNETEVLLSKSNLNNAEISIRAIVLDDSLKELLILTKQFPEVSETFARSPSYSRFQIFLKGNLNVEEHRHLFGDLKTEVQTLVENYLFKKNEDIQSQIHFGYLSTAIGFIGAGMFFFLMFLIYRRYQKNLENLQTTSQNLEEERLVSIQSSRMAALGIMAAGLAHEVNNPLAVIQARTEFLSNSIRRGTATDSDVTNTIGKIDEMATRIGSIVNSMLKISREDSQNLNSKINLYGVVKDVLNLTSERLRHLNIGMDIKDLNKDIEIKANFTQLSQVLINLINNAVDELQKRPKHQRQIWLSTETTEKHVLLKVIDSGPGIPSDVREKLFQPFFTTKEVGRGTGLGLSISKNIMLKMGGDLTLSTDTTQTCFIISLIKA